jgi:hypothetical protein
MIDTRIKIALLYKQEDQINHVVWRFTNDDHGLPRVEVHHFNKATTTRFNAQ